MYLVAIGWLYVALMAALAEAMHSSGSILGAVLTFVGWGLLPVFLILYILGTPARKRALRAPEAAEQSKAIEVHCEQQLPIHQEASQPGSSNPDARSETPTAS